MNRFLFSLFLALSVSVSALAITISGTVVDNEDQSPMIGATVKLLKASRDSSLVKGVTADEDGKFWLTNVKAGKYVLSIDYIGYDKLSKNISVTDGASNMALGKLPLTTSSIMLKEAQVVGVKTEIKVKEDTIEYNADSYKTQPNAVVEDLLKRLPGVEVGSDGKVTSNGKEITKILVDGKEFFASDTKVGTKNIPVNIVDKVQVVDRKSDLARLTGVDDGEDETVINLTVKKGMNNGWFGNVSAGYGTDDRYEGNVMVNRFSNGNQFTLLGGGNNTNNMAFTNGAGARFMRFGGVNGINTTQNVGMNFNVGNGDKFRVGGNVMYSHSDQDTRQNTNRQYLFSDSTSYLHSLSASRDKSHNVNGDFRLKWEVDSFNTLEFRPNFSFNFNNSLRNDTSLTQAGDAALTKVNSSRNIDSSKGRSYEFGGELVFNHKFQSHPGRSFSVQMRYNFSDKHEDGDTYTHNTYYLLDEPNEIIDQISNNHTWSNAIQSRLSWTEPLGDIKNARFLTFSYRMQYRFNNADKMVYDMVDNSTNPTPAPPCMGKVDLYRALLSNNQVIDYLKDEYTAAALTNPLMLEDILLAETQNLSPVWNQDLSNQFRNDFFTQTLQIGFKQVRKTFNLDAGLSLNPSMSRSKNLINSAKDIPTRWVWNFAPYARIRLKMSKTRSLAFDYRGRSSQPSMSQLQPVADLSNPLRIVVGNPNLKPTFSHRINLRFNDFNQSSQRSVMAMANVQFEQNSIISKTDFNRETGGQTTTYDNVNGVWNAMTMGMISMPLPNKKFYYSTNIMARFSNTIGYNNGEYNRSGSLSLNVSPGISYRTGIIELELRPNYRLQYTHNTVQTSSNRTIHTYGGTFNGSYYLPFGLSFNTDLSYSATSGYSAGYDSKQWLWNGSVTYEFLKNKVASISAKVYDILGQKKRISRSVTANYIQDSEYNSLTRYAMFTFTYRFNTFGGSKTPADTNRSFMYEGRGPGRHF